MDELTDEFRTRVLDPATWRECAQSLLATAELIEPKFDEFWTQDPESRVGQSTIYPGGDQFPAVYFMLCAFAIENLLKARIVERDRELVQAALDKGNLPKLLKSHRLYKLAKKAGHVELARRHELLLTRLETSAVWYGRYPAPLFSDGLALGHPAESLEPPYLASTRGTYVYLDRERIREIVRELMPQQPTVRDSNAG